MKIEKLQISKEKFDINLKFYFFLKYLVKTNLSDNQVVAVLKIDSLKLPLQSTLSMIEKYANEKIKKGSKKQELLFEIMNEVVCELTFELFIFSLKLYRIKDLLLQEAKLRDLLDISKLNKLDPLSLEYDKITLYSPYATRVNGALLSLIFFEKLEKEETNFISQDAESYIQELAITALKLKNRGIESNQIFMLMFNESINQSIISDSGSNYEDRIFSVLIAIGIEEEQIQKVHDKEDSSTEFDFFFELDGRSYGIGAKKTLRERYKQFIKTAQMSQVDVMIEVTLGVDLTKEKVLAIRNHNVFLFVANEIYESQKYLQEIDGVYSSKELTISVLKNLNS